MDGTSSRKACWRPVSVEIENRRLHFVGVFRMADGRNQVFGEPTTIFDYFDTYHDKFQDDLKKAKKSGTDQVGNSIKLSDLSVLGKFITCNRGFQDKVLKLKAAVLDHLKKRRPIRPLSIMLVAPPGSGKSFFVNQLADSVKTRRNIEFSEFQVGAMTNPAEVLSVFRRIQSLNLEAKYPIVFLDEVDVAVGDDYVFRYLLAPMADGKYYFEGYPNNLGNAILVFAGSQIIIPDQTVPFEGYVGDAIDYWSWALRQRSSIWKNVRRQSIPKLADFLDRITIPIVMPPLTHKFADSEYLTEVRAITLSLIRKYYKSVTRIEYPAALTVMSILSGTDTKRQAESAVFLSSPPKGERFMFANLPPEQQDDFMKRFKDYISESSNLYFYVEE